MKARTGSSPSSLFAFRCIGTTACAIVLAGSLAGAGIAAPLAQAEGTGASSVEGEATPVTPADGVTQPDQGENSTVDTSTSPEPDSAANPSSSQAAPQEDVARDAQQAVPNQTPAPVVDEAAARALAELPALMNKLESASSEYDRAYAEYQSAADALARAEQTISADQEAIARAQKALDAAQSELDSEEGGSI